MIVISFINTLLNTTDAPPVFWEYSSYTTKQFNHKVFHYLYLIPYLQDYYVILVTVKMLKNTLNYIFLH